MIAAMASFASLAILWVLWWVAQYSMTKIVRTFLSLLILGCGFTAAAQDIRLLRLSNEILNRAIAVSLVPRFGRDCPNAAGLAELDVSWKRRNARLLKVGETARVLYLLGSLASRDPPRMDLLGALTVQADLEMEKRVADLMEARLKDESKYGPRCQQLLALLLVGDLPADLDVRHASVFRSVLAVSDLAFTKQ